MTERFGFALRLKTNAFSQYGAYGFNSMCRFNGVALAANSEGIFKLDDGDSDNGEFIQAILEQVTTNLGSLNYKWFRRVWVGYETNGRLLFKFQTDENEVASITLDPKDPGQRQHRSEVDMSRDDEGVYWMFRVENVDGSDFSLDEIEGLPIIMPRGYGG